MLLKRNNLIVVKPIDFGLSRPLNKDQSGKPLDTKGTLNFIDPLWMNKEHTGSALNDVYSLGITYVYMLYGPSYVNMGLQSLTSREEYNEKVKVRDTTICQLFEDFLDPDNEYKRSVAKCYSQRKPINMINQPIKIIFNSEERTTLNGLIKDFESVLKIINTESIYLPKRAKDLYDSFMAT